MSKVIKKITAGLLACFVTVLSVMAIGGVAFAAPPCSSDAKLDGKDGKVGNITNAESLTQCSACVGTKMSEGNSKYDALRKCKSTSTSEMMTVDSVWPMVWTVINWVLIAVGIVCVVFIIIGGIRYATSGGDPEKTKSAKNTILYALIGLAISVLANVIVQIVFSATSTIITPPPAEETKTTLVSPPIIQIMNG